MIDSFEKCKRQLGFELQNSCVSEKCSNQVLSNQLIKKIPKLWFAGVFQNDET